MFGAMMRLMLIVLLGLAACDDGGSAAIDAGLDAQRRLTLTVEGTGSVEATRSITVEIMSNGTTRMDSFTVGGLPATVDLPAPIQLADWEIEVDGFDMVGQLIGRGNITLPSGTSAARVTLGPL